MEINLAQGMGHREFLAFQYALINPMQLEPEQWRDLPSKPLRPQGIDAGPEMLPQVIALNGLSHDRCLELLTRSERWMQSMRRPLFSALLCSDQPQDVLVAHFNSQMTVNRPDKQKFWLRFHDPRVFARLDWLLNDAQKRQLFGPVEAWAWWDVLDGQWRIRHKPIQPSQHMPTVLATEQWAALDRLPLLNRCLKRLARDKQLLQGYQSQAERIDGFLQEALSLGLTDQDDACLYAVNIEMHGLQWPKQPHIQKALLLAIQAEQSLVRSLADLGQAPPNAAAYRTIPSSRYA